VVSHPIARGSPASAAPTEPSSSIRRRAKKSDVDKQLSNWTKRRVLSWSLFGLAGVVAVQHLLAHAGWRPVPLSMGWQDVLIGYPMAIVLAIVGAIVLDPRPRI
jgi:hypothetical protein